MKYLCPVNFLFFRDILFDFTYIFQTILRSAKDFSSKDSQLNGTWQALKSVRNSTVRMSEQQDRLQGVTEKVDALIKSTAQILESNKQDDTITV
eukprot:m.341348 g.341348  ORF g.341348 m.341348 type:complete len:94 (+) comp20608_c0_seq1:328-609(+)